MVFTVYNSEQNGSLPSTNKHDKKPFLSLRWTLVILEFFMYFTMFFMRNSFAVTLVAMVNSTQSASDPKYSEDTCVPNNTIDSDDPGGLDGEFLWDADAQGVLLGVYFWGFCISKLFVSRVGEIVGQRATVATGMGCAALFTLLSPTAAVYGGVYALAVVRFLVGFSIGPISASMHSLLSAWAPRSELSRMITTAFTGLTLGGTAGMTISGWLSEQLGWRACFWISGSLPFLVIPFWIVIVRNKPLQHPWLSNHERKILMQNKTVTTKKYVPWMKILTSPYLFIITFAQFSRVWLDTVLATEGPAFYNYKIGLSLSTSSYVLGGAYFSSIFWMIIFGRISDFIINRKFVSTVNARRIFHVIASPVTSLCIIVICLADCDTSLVITFWILSGGLACATSCSYNASVIDLAPNYTATFMGAMGIGNLAGAITPLATSALLSKENGWSKSFYLAAGLNLASGLVYIAFITADAQPWNFEDPEAKDEKKTIKTKEK